MSYIISWKCKNCGHDHYWSFGPIHFPGSEADIQVRESIKAARIHICRKCYTDMTTGMVSYIDFLPSSFEVFYELTFEGELHARAQKAKADLQAAVEKTKADLKKDQLPFRASLEAEIKAAIQTEYDRPYECPISHRISIFCPLPDPIICKLACPLYCPFNIDPNKAKEWIAVYGPYDKALAHDREMRNGTYWGNHPRWCPGEIPHTWKRR
jgi:hypothetical protein